MKIFKVALIEGNSPSVGNEACSGFRKRFPAAVRLAKRWLKTAESEFPCVDIFTYTDKVKHIVSIVPSQNYNQRSEK